MLVLLANAELAQVQAPEDTDGASEEGSPALDRQMRPPVVIPFSDTTQLVI